MTASSSPSSVSNRPPLASKQRASRGWCPRCRGTRDSARLELLVHVLRAADEAHRRHAVAVAVERRRCAACDEPRVVGEAEVVVGAEVEHLGARLELDLRRLRAFDHPLGLVEAVGADCIDRRGAGEQYVLVEQTAAPFAQNCAIEPRGRVTQGDLGMWDDGQIEGHKRLVRFLKQEGALAGTQITHAGRKGSTPRSFDKPGELGPTGAGWQRWEVVGPSELSAGEGWPMPRQLGAGEIDDAREEVRRGRAARRCRGLRRRSRSTARTATCWRSSCRRSATSATTSMAATAPAACASRSRRRKAVRENWPEHKPMFIRVSAVDGAGGWDVEDTVAFAKELKALGIDVIDTSSGGLTGLSTALPVKRSLGFQVPFAAAVKRQADIPTMAVGLILDGPQAEADPAGRRRRPDRDRPPGALRSVLAAACGAGAGLRRRLRDVERPNTAGGSTSAGTTSPT